MSLHTHDELGTLHKTEQNEMKVGLENVDIPRTQTNEEYVILNQSTTPHHIA